MRGGETERSAGGLERGGGLACLLYGSLKLMEELLYRHTDGTDRPQVLLRAKVDGLAGSKGEFDLGGDAVVLDAVADDLDEAGNVSLREIFHALAAEQRGVRSYDIDGRVFGTGLHHGIDARSVDEEHVLRGTSLTEDQHRDTLAGAGDTARKLDYGVQPVLVGSQVGAKRSDALRAQEIATRNDGYDRTSRGDGLQRMPNQLKVATVVAVKGEALGSKPESRLTVLAFCLKKLGLSSGSVSLLNLKSGGGLA